MINFRLQKLNGPQMHKLNYLQSLTSVAAELLCHGTARRRRKWTTYTNAQTEADRRCPSSEKVKLLYLFIDNRQRIEAALLNLEDDVVLHLVEYLDSSLGGWWQRR